MLTFLLKYPPKSGDLKLPTYGYTTQAILKTARSWTFLSYKEQVQSLSSIKYYSFSLSS